MIAPPILDRAGEVQKEIVGKFANAEATESIRAAEDKASLALEKAEAEGQKLLATVQRARNLFGAATRARHIAIRGRALAGAVDPAQQALGIVEAFGAKDPNPAQWQPALSFGAEIIVMAPFLTKAADHFDAQAEKAEHELRDLLKGSAVNVQEIGADFRRQEDWLAGEVDELLARLSAE